MPAIPRLPNHPKIGVPLFEARFQIEGTLVKLHLVKLLDEAQPLASELNDITQVAERTRSALDALECALIALLEPDAKT